MLIQTVDNSEDNSEASMLIQTVDNSEEQARGLAHAALVATLWLSFTNVKVFKATEWLERVTKDYDRTAEQALD